MLPGFALNPGPQFRGARWIALGASAACAAAVAMGLFALMMFLVRPPRPPARHKAFSVFLRAAGPLPSPVHPARATSRKRPPRLRRRPGSTLVTAPPRPPVLRPIRMPSLPDASRLALRPDIRAAAPVPSPVQWRQALEQYLGARSGPSPFSKPRLPGHRAPAPVLGGLTRLRTGDGGEIDRIGDRCYAVPAADPLPEMAADPGHARFMQALQPLFAHRVTCPGGSRDTLGESFLKALRRQLGGPP